MNWTLYGTDESFILVGCGIAMLKDVPGIEPLTPSANMLKPILSKIKRLQIPPER